MRPFSSFYFIRENKVRCLLLMFMLFLGYAAYLGGIYASNPLDNWRLPIGYYKEMAQAYPSNSDAEAADFYAFTEELQKSGKMEILQLGRHNGFDWHTIMGFESGQFSLSFMSVEDFKTYCSYMGIDCDFSRVKNKSLIMSELFARNLGLELGDQVDKDDAERVFDTYTLDALTEEDGYSQYFIDEDCERSNNILMFGRGISGGELYRLIYETKEKYDVQVFDTLEADITEQLETFKLIFFFILGLMATVLAVTINAAFVGMYQRRNFEFAVYRAIGISRGRIVGKVMGELLLMDVIAMAAGGLIFFLGLYLFNHMVLYPKGYYLQYFNSTALTALLLCNGVVVVPLIVSRCRQMLRADICDY